MLRCALVCKGKGREGGVGIRIMLGSIGKWKSEAVKGMILCIVKKYIVW